MMIPPQRSCNELWTRRMMEVREEEACRAEVRRQEVLEQVTEQAGGFRAFPTHDSSNSNHEASQHQEPTPHNSGTRRQEVSELDARPRVLSPRRSQLMPTPALVVDSSAESIHNTIAELRAWIANQQAYIRSLESNIRHSELEVQRLETEHRAAESEHLRAILDNERDEVKVATLETKVAELVKLLEAARNRVDELDRMVHEGRKRERELDRECREAQQRIQDADSGESETRNTGAGPLTREAEILRAALGSGGGSNSQQAWNQRFRELERLLAERGGAEERGVEERGAERGARDLGHAGENRSSAAPRILSQQARDNGYLSIPGGSGRYRFFALC